MNQQPGRWSIRAAADLALASILMTLLPMALTVSSRFLAVGIQMPGLALYLDLAACRT